jgi:glycosyltransferase involved in cell wall biosynthesis
LSDLVFVLEQTLGHVAHARNILRLLEANAGSIRSTVIPVAPLRNPTLAARIPGLRSWSFEASRQARSALLKRLRAGRVDAVFIHTQVAALLSGSIMARVPTVVSLDATPRNYDSQGASYGHSVSHPALEAVKLRLNQSIFRRAAALVTWCRWAADSLVADYGVPASRITVIRPGVDIERFRPQPRDGATDTVRILFVGGDFQRKGGQDLLEAMRGLAGRAELDVVTNAEVRVPAGVVCRVHRGLVPQAPALVNLYRAADIFALPSRGDCFPQAVAEGLAAGLPVVASTAGAIPEMVTEGVNGHLVPPGEPRALGRALEALVRSAPRRREMGHESRLLAEREHDADANNRRIVDLMLSLGRERREAPLTA